MKEDGSLEDLKKTNAILSGIIESPRNVVIFALDTGYRYIAYNSNHRKTMRTIWGAEIEKGKNMLDYISSEEDRKKARMNFDKVLRGRSFTLEEQYGDTAHERRYYEDIYNPIIDEKGDIIGLTVFLTDITERKTMEHERNKLITELQNALDNVKMLTGLLPVCSHCKKIRTENEDWQPIEHYIRDHSEAQFSHSLCPECVSKLYPDLIDDSKEQG